MTKDALNRADIVDLVFDKTGYSRAVSEKILNAVFDIISEQVSCGKKVRFNDFGLFYRVVRKSRALWEFGENKNLVLPERYDVVFKPAKRFRAKVASVTPANAVFKND